jgi:chromate transporter
MADSAARSRVPVGDVARLFLKLGLTAFGGPAAHVALMEEEVVRRRGWITHAEFVDLLGAANLIPGPNSTELAIHLGYRMAGAAGLIAAGVCFIGPAVLITLAFAWSYVRFGATHAADILLYGIKPAVIAVVLGAVARLARVAVRRPLTAAIAIIAAAASLAGGDEVLVLLAAGAVAAVAAHPRRSDAALGGIQLIAPFAPLAAGAIAATSASEAGLVGLGLFFLKVGSVLYGSGYVLIAFLRGGLVADRHWLTERQLLDAIAIGQFTPGPVLSTATFVGYLIHGLGGAAVATLAIFMPSFVLVALTNPLIPRLRSMPLMAGFLDGVNAASIGLIAAVVIQLGREALIGWPSWVIGAVGVMAALTRLNPTWVILGGAALGAMAAAAGAGR